MHVTTMITTKIPTAISFHNIKTSVNLLKHQTNSARLHNILKSLLSMFSPRVADKNTNSEHPSQSLTHSSSPSYWLCLLIICFSSNLSPESILDLSVHSHFAKQLLSLVSQCQAVRTYHGYPTTVILLDSLFLLVLAHLTLPCLWHWSSIACCGFVCLIYCQ